MTIRFSFFSFNETIEERNLSKLWKPRWTVYKRLFRLLQETFQRSSHLEQTKQCPTFTYLSFFLTFITSFFLYAAHINRKLACLNAKFLKVKWRSSCLSQCSDKISLSFEILSNICELLWKSDWQRMHYFNSSSFQFHWENAMSDI
jgi:hypothetical protein